MYVSRQSIVAEEEGFEPSHRVTSLRAFQARPFSRLGIPPDVASFNAIGNVRLLLYKKVLFIKRGKC